jgi:hypothetical protein
VANGGFSCLLQKRTVDGTVVVLTLWPQRFPLFINAVVKTKFKLAEYAKINPFCRAFLIIGVGKLLAKTCSVPAQFID